MKKLTVKDLWTLEDYAEMRAGFRVEVMEHKKARKLQLGAHLTLLFEDQITIKYQIQEMLRIERIFERAAIQEELDAYNPLIPDGTNWKATCLVEFEDRQERIRRLTELRGLERQIWAQVGDHPPIRSFADEDMDREDEEKTSAVHFLRFELDPESQKLAKAGALIRFGVSHPAYTVSTLAAEPLRAALIRDLD